MKKHEFLGVVKKVRELCREVLKQRRSQELPSEITKLIRDVDNRYADIKDHAEWKKWRALLSRISSDPLNSVVDEKAKNLLDLFLRHKTEDELIAMRDLACCRRDFDKAHLREASLAKLNGPRSHY